MDYLIKADKLTAHNTKGQIQSAIYIAPADIGSDSNLGRLFIVAAIDSKEKRVPDILEQTLKELSEYYYHSPTKNSEAALETTCQYFNENITDITDKNTKWIREKFNILIATIQKDGLILSNMGDIKAWLLRNRRMHDITAGQTKPKKNTTSKKLLNQLVSGQLEENDALLLTNNTIFDYFSHEKIQKTVTTLLPAQACAFFKNTLLDYKVPIDFNTVIIKFSQPKKETLANIPKSILESDNKNNHKLDFKHKESKIKTVVNIAKNTGQKIFNNTSQVINDFKKKKTDKPDKSTEEKIPVKSISTKDNSEPTALSKPPTLLARHRLKIAILLIAVIFVSSLFLVNRKKEEQLQINNFEKIIIDINDKINASEAALIYKDEDKAQTLLAEAKTLAHSLSQDTEEQTYQRQQLLEKINTEINRIYHIEQITSPAQVANLDQLGQPTSNIALIKNNLYTAEGGAVYKINPGDNSLVRVADINNTITKILSFDTNLLLLGTNNNKFFILNIDNNSSRELAYPDSNIIDFATYAKKLYILDDNYQIYKYSYNTNGFSSPTKWLKQDIDLTGNQSIAVDGSIWLTAKDSQVSKFFKGQQEVFKLTGLIDPLSGNTSLYTTESLSALYLLDQDNKKIIITNKQGKITKTILIPESLNIKSITPSTDETTLYLMTDEAVYKIEI